MDHADDVQLKKNPTPTKKEPIKQLRRLRPPFIMSLKVDVPSDRATLLLNVNSKPAKRFIEEMQVDIARTMKLNKEQVGFLRIVDVRLPRDARNGILVIFRFGPGLPAEASDGWTDDDALYAAYGSKYKECEALVGVLKKAVGNTHSQLYRGKLYILNCVDPALFFVGTQPHAPSFWKFPSACMFMCT